jgi:hypothetical protein
VIMGDQRDATLVDETQFACNRAAPKQTPPPPPGLDASACRWCVRTHPTRKHAHKHRVGSYIAASDPRSASFSRYSTYLVLTGVKHEHRACARTPPRAHTDGTIGVGESRCVCVCVCVCMRARVCVFAIDRPEGCSSASGKKFRNCNWRSASLGRTEWRRLLGVLARSPEKFFHSTRGSVASAREKPNSQTRERDEVARGKNSVGNWSATGDRRGRTFGASQRRAAASIGERSKCGVCARTVDTAKSL